MLPSRLFFLLFSASTLIVPAQPVFAQNYPAKVVRMITSEPGGGSDFAARLIAQGLAANLGQQVIVDNRGGGVSAAEIVAKAPPDGYTVLVYGSTLWIQPFLRSATPWDAVRDFSPVTLAVRAPNVLVVHPSLPVKSVTGLIALAKARPGELNYSSGSAGSSAHLSAALFSTMAGVNVVRINYRGNGPALNGLITGEVQLMFPTAGSVAGHIKSGRLRALGVASAEQSELLPGLPTVAAGLPGFECGTVTGIFVPAGTPAAIVNRLNFETVKVLQRAEVKERFFSAAVEVVGSSSEQFAVVIKSEMARLGKVIRDAGIGG